jgi:DNA-binding NarL/FixJ family response regulator
MPDIHIMVLTMHEVCAILKEIMNAGASGYILKCAALFYIRAC